MPRSTSIEDRLRIISFLAPVVLTTWGMFVNYVPPH